MTVNEKFENLTKNLIAHGYTIATMESCTAGLIASLITDTEGSSEVFKGSFVTYCNEAKIANGVPENIIRDYGVYSEETAEAMALACKDRFKSDIGVGITGSFANPDPANADSTPGEIYYAIQYFDKLHIYSAKLLPTNDRFHDKLAAAELICDNLMKLIK